MKSAISESIILTHLIRFMSILVVYKNRSSCVCAYVWVLWDCCVCHVNEPHYWETKRSGEEWRGEEWSKDFVFVDIYCSPKERCCVIYCYHVCSISLFLFTCYSFKELMPACCPLLYDRLVIQQPTWVHNLPTNKQITVTIQAGLVL